jgi:hypothetical protein
LKRSDALSFSQSVTITPTGLIFQEAFVLRPIPSGPVRGASIADAECSSAVIGFEAPSIDRDALVEAVRALIAQEG